MNTTDVSTYLFSKPPISVLILIPKIHAIIWRVGEPIIENNDCSSNSR